MAIAAFTAAGALAYVSGSILGPERLRLAGFVLVGAAALLAVAVYTPRPGR